MLTSLAPIQLPLDSGTKQMTRTAIAPPLPAHMRMVLLAKSEQAFSLMAVTQSSAETLLQ